MSADDDPELWLEQYGDAMYSFARARLSDHAAAEDAVQETFLAAVRKRDSFDGRSSRLTWLIGILKRKIIDHYRKVSRERERTVSADAMAGIDHLFNERGEFKRTIREWPTDPAEAMEDSEFWQVFHACREALPNNLQQTFNLRELEQMDSANVCDVLNISASNLAVRIHRARLLMRQCLERKWFRD